MHEVMARRKWYIQELRRISRFDTEGEVAQGHVVQAAVLIARLLEADRLAEMGGLSTKILLRIDGCQKDPEAQRRSAALRKALRTLRDESQGEKQDPALDALFKLLSALNGALGISPLRMRRLPDGTDGSSSLLVLRAVEAAAEVLLPQVSDQRKSA